MSIAFAAVVTVGARLGSARLGSRMQADIGMGGESPLVSSTLDGLKLVLRAADDSNSSDDAKLPSSLRCATELACQLTYQINRPSGTPLATAPLTRLARLGSHRAAVASFGPLPDCRARPRANCGAVSGACSMAAGIHALTLSLSLSLCLCIHNCVCL